MDQIEGKPIVTSMEHKTYPFYGVLWHPEVPLESSDTLNTIRDPVNKEIAKVLSQYLSNECKKNEQSFTDDKELINQLVNNGYLESMDLTDQLSRFDLYQ